jgi:hypothetical protein
VCKGWLALRPGEYTTGTPRSHTAMAIMKVIFRARRQVLGMGPDSLAVLVLYGIGTAGPLAAAQPISA